MSHDVYTRTRQEPQWQYYTTVESTEDDAFDDMVYQWMLANRKAYGEMETLPEGKDIRDMLPPIDWASKGLPGT